MSKNGIQNAQDIIEAFGGIRPMANKINVAVSTIQGWKKRDVIPVSRKSVILSAANEHNVDLTGLIDGASFANQNDNAAVESNDEPVVLDQRVEETSYSDPDDEGADFDTHLIASVSNDVSDEVHAAKPKTGEEKVLTSEAAGSYDVRTTSPKAVGLIAVLIVLLGGLAIAAYFWQANNARKAEEARLAALEEQLNAVQNEVDVVQESQGFLGNILPKDMGEKLNDLQQQAVDLKNEVGNAAQTAKETAQIAQEKVQAVSEDVLAKDAGNLEQRALKLETHLQDITGQPVLAGMLSRVQSLQGSAQGNEILDTTVAELNQLFASLDVQGLNGVEGASDQVINSTLDGARTQSEALGTTFSSVPQQDLKAAAMLLGMSQLRSSLNRNNDAFENDLGLLKKLVGENNPELNAALDRLAPHAQSGVLTPSGLSTELRTFAGDAVAASLAGEDVSVQERAKARMNDIFQVEKDGELISGTETQASLVKADQLLQQGDVAGAISAVEAIDGPAGQALAPWLEKAGGSLDAQNASGLVTDILQGNLPEGLGGKHLYDKESGINVYVPRSGPVQ